MAMPYESDIFISYAHLDDLALPGETGWVSMLHEVLRIRLSQLLGREPRIWRDKKLQGNDYFADTLVEQLPKVAALISIVSPRYVESEWCRRELTTFHDAARASGHLRQGNKSRIFKVIKTELPFDRHPPEILDLLGYELYLKDPQTGRPTELGLGETSTVGEKQLFRKRIEDLAYDLKELLESIDREADAAGVSPGPGPTSAPRAPAEEEEDETKVYLAQTTYDLKEDHDTIRRLLEGAGCRVVPDQMLPLIGPECESFVRDQLEGCKLAVQLVGGVYDIVPQGSIHSLGEIQFHAAAERPDLQRLLWIPPGSSTDDGRQQAFLDALEIDPRLGASSDLLKTALEDFQIALKNALEPPAPPPDVGADDGEHDGEGGRLNIYLIFDQRDADLDETWDLRDFLHQQGYSILLPEFEGDPGEVRAYHQENLKLCDAVLIYYGTGNEMWVNRKLRELATRPALGSDKPLRSKAVFVAPPAHPRKRRFLAHDTLVLRSDESFSTAAVRPLLEVLV